MRKVLVIDGNSPPAKGFGAYICLIWETQQAS
jgi:hypothetical protein